MSQERRKWSLKEDNILKIAIGKDVERIDWRSVADHLPGRNNKECRKRWYQKFATNTNHGSWTEGEDTRLRTAIARHGTKWAAVARDVGTRSSEQCSKRWNDVLNPDLDRTSPWTPEDDNLLMSNVDTHGRNWKIISQLHFQNRAALALKNRYALLLRRQARGSQSRDIRFPSPSSPYSNRADSPSVDESGSITDNENGAAGPPSISRAGETASTLPGAVDNGSMALCPSNESQTFFPEYLPEGNHVFQTLGSNEQHGIAQPAPIDFSVLDDVLMEDTSRLIEVPSLSQELQPQHHAYPEMPSLQNPAARTSFPTPQSSTPSNNADTWNDFLCLGIRCPRKALDVLKMSILEAATKIPSGHHDDDGDENVQIMLKIRKES